MYSYTEMDPSRRSMMQPPPDPTGRSGIPMPTTIKRPNQSTNHRMSLAGRAPYPAPPIVPSTNPRQSIMRNQNTNQLLQSASKSVYGKTPVNNNRRGSIWGGGLAMQPGAAQLMKDTRNLRDRANQAKMRQDIVGYLQSIDSEFLISPSILASITSKDFRTIFIILVQNIDRNYPVGQKRLEDEFIPALKALKYPFAHQMDNKWLAAPASPHTWPWLLGALHWLVEVGRLRDQYITSDHPTLQVIDIIPAEFDNPAHHDALAFDFYDNCYNLWIDQIDDISEPKQRLDDRYDKKNERLEQDLANQRKQLLALEFEHEQLVSSSKELARLEEEHTNMTQDLLQAGLHLNKYIERITARRESIEVLVSETQNAATELAACTTELERLQKAIAEQGISPEEAQKMTATHEQLIQSLDEWRHREQNARENVGQHQVTFHHAIDAVDEILQSYSYQLSVLGLEPPLPPPLETLDLRLSLNSSDPDPNSLLTGPDVSAVIKPALSQLAKMKQNERSKVEETRLQVEEEWDKINAECENLQEDTDRLIQQARHIFGQAEATRVQTQDEVLEASTQAAKLENDIRSAKASAAANGIGVKSKLQTLQIKYQEQVEKVNKLRNETINAILRSSNHIATFKEEVSQQLAAVKAAAENHH